MEPDKLAALIDRLPALFGNNPKGWARNIDWPQAEAYIRATYAGETGSTLAFIDNAAVMFSVGGNWWAAKPVLAEELLLSIDGKPIDLPRVLGFLERLASMYGCAGVALGTSLSTRDASLVRLYRSHGYLSEAHMLYKGIT